MELDDALKSLGDFGRYQTIVYVLICLVGQLTQSGHMLAISFLGALPDHNCCVPTTTTTTGLDATSRFTVYGYGGGSRHRRTVDDEHEDDNWGVDGFCPPEVGGGNDEDVVFSSCLKYVNASISNATEECVDGWTYDYDQFGDTIVTEWDLVCEEDYKVDLSSSIFMAGVMVGSLLFGHLSDRYGRKPVWFGAIWTQVAFGVAAAFSPNYWTFVVMRFFVGVLEQGVDLPSFVMVTEMFSPDVRDTAGIIACVFWATGIMILPGLAYLIKDWRYLQLALSLPNILTIFIYRIIPETSRWLLIRGKIEKVEENLLKIAKFNNIKDMPTPILSVSQTSSANEGVIEDIIRDSQIVDNDNNGFAISNQKEPADPQKESIATDHSKKNMENPVGESNELNDKVNSFNVVNGDAKNLTMSDERVTIDNRSTKDLIEEKERNYTFLDLFWTSHIRKLTLIMIFEWFVNAVLYYGLSLNTDSLAGDPYLNFFLIGAVEFPAYLFAAAVAKWVGRRLPLCALFTTAGIACIVIAFIPTTTASGTDLSPLILTVTLIGKFCVSSSFATLFLYATELFPTVVRNQGVGVSSLASSIGGVVAPLLLLVDSDIAWLLLTVFGISAVVAGFSVLLLPETRGRIQPQTVEEASEMQRPRRHDPASAAHTNHGNTCLEDIDTQL